MSAPVEVTQARFEDIGDTDADSNADWYYRGYDYEVTVDGRTFHVRSYDDSPTDAIVATARPDTTDRRSVIGGSFYAEHRIPDRAVL